MDENPYKSPESVEEPGAEKSSDQPGPNAWLPFTGIGIGCLLVLVFGWHTDGARDTYSVAGLALGAVLFIGLPLIILALDLLVYRKRSRNP